jgi:hypothetical protein
MHVVSPSDSGDPVQYSLPTKDGEKLEINSFINKTLSLHYKGKIFCAACGRASKKSFNQGYCYPCFKSLARCDMCIMKPETCHYHEGTCREPEWADQHCMQAHYVYLSNASGLKVGITRQDQLPTRWIDQGAIQAVALYKVKNRYLAGLIEVCLGEEMKDKTNWRAMLKGEVETLDLDSIANEVKEKFAEKVTKLSEDFGEASLQVLSDKTLNLNYPVESYPVKIKSYNFDKEPSFEDTLVGIKGQYLIFENGVINIRKFGSYQIELKVKS